MILAYKNSGTYSRVSSGTDEVKADVDTSVMCFYQVSLDLQLLLKIDFKLVVSVFHYWFKTKQIKQKFKILS